MLEKVDFLREHSGHWKGVPSYFIGEMCAQHYYNIIVSAKGIGDS